MLNLQKKLYLPDILLLLIRTNNYLISNNINYSIEKKLTKILNGFIKIDKRKATYYQVIIVKLYLTFDHIINIVQNNEQRLFNYYSIINDCIVLLDKNKYDKKMYLLFIKELYKQIK